VGRPEVIALFGPTGVGKTEVALALAAVLRSRGEEPVAVGADALQLYAGLPILTGAPGARERGLLEHRLVGVVPLRERFSAGAYAALAHAEIDGLLAAGRLPIVVGGTGLYLRAALTDLDLHPPPEPGARERWEAAVATRGAPAVHAELRDRAPWAAAGIDPNDRSRIVRAHELLDAGALEGPRTTSRLWTADMRRPTLLAGLTMDRAALAARIDERVDRMIAAGAVEEVRRADAAGASATARAALGFDELLAGDVEAMKLRTRRYAKRQLTWMRKLSGVRTIDVTGREPEAVAARIVALWAGEAGQ